MNGLIKHLFTSNRPVAQLTSEGPAGLGSNPRGFQKMMSSFSQNGARCCNTIVP